LSEAIPRITNAKDKDGKAVRRNRNVGWDILLEIFTARTLETGWTFNRPPEKKIGSLVPH
jgi:hypothetical protein